MLRFSFFIIIFIIILEVILNSINPSVYESDKTLGWKLKKNFSHSFKIHTSKNKKYIANQENINHYTGSKHLTKQF